MTEPRTKQKTFDNKIIDSKKVEIKGTREKCMYCGKYFKILDGRHLSSCERYLEYKEKAKRTQSSIIDFCQQITRKSYPIEQIFPNSWNVNSMSYEEYEALKESIQKTKGEFLKNNPIQIRELEKDKYEIIDGEHRWRACKDLKYTHIPAIVETNVDIEKAKVMTVISSQNRGKIDYFKYSKLLNEEYYDENGKKRCTQINLAEKFGMSGGKKEINRILNIYRKLKIIFTKSRVDTTFEKEALVQIARCKDDLLREKLVDQAIKNEWSAKKIRDYTTKLNRISKYLLTEISHQSVRDCVLKLCTGTSIFELSYDAFIEKIFRLFIENERNGVIMKYVREFEIHSRIAREHRSEYAKNRRGEWDGWYKESYIKSSKFTAGSKMAWDFFREFYHGNANCFYCNKEIALFKDFTPHHEPYEWDYLWFIFLDLDQKIFPCCNTCHQPGNSKNWKNKCNNK